MCQRELRAYFEVSESIIQHSSVHALTVPFYSARVSVHFQAIIEQFTPHDTIFSFTTAKGLNDLALSSACSLHTASASIKSSSDSLRQRGLSGIVEDASEYRSPETDGEPPSENIEGLIGNSTLQNLRKRMDSLSNTQTTTAQPSIERRGSISPTRRVRNTDKALPPTPGDCTEDKATTRNALEDTFLDSRPSVEGRPSMQSIRPSIRSNHTSYEYKHKFRLGPRPSLESPSGFHGQERSGDIRPVSTLPTGVHLAARKQAPVRPQAANGRMPILETSEIPLPSPKPMSTVTHETVWYPLPTALPKQLQNAENTPSAMTPEKRRLKKALELRQKQLAARKAQEASEKEEDPQIQLVQPSSDPIKRESFTATLPDVSPVDDTITDVLQERIDALNRNPDLVHVGPQNVGKIVPESFEVSPISIPEASDDPSTQASSVSDQDETPTNAEPTAGKEVLSNHLADACVHEQSYAKDSIFSEQKGTQSDEQISTSETSCIDECKTRPPLFDIPFVGRVIDGEIGTSMSDGLRSPSVSARYEGSTQQAPVKVDSISDSDSSLPIPELRWIKNGTSDLKPHEIPLPLIDESEEFSLNPQRKALGERSKPNSRRERQRLESTRSQEENQSSKEFKSSTAAVTSEQRERRTRRHGLINPIKRVSSPDYSDEQFLSDDSFMEELKSATVQEAKPISVSKSPILPVFPRSASESKSTEELRPTSASSRLKSPGRQDDLPMMPKLPDLYSARSVSAPYAPLLEAQLSPPTLKKVGVSSGISQRIKLLEQLSSRPTSPSSQLSSPSTAPGSSSAFPNPRKTSFRASQAAAEIARSSTQTSKPRSRLPYRTKSGSPDRKSNSLRDGVVRIDVATQSGKARPESISVTARIIRGSQNKISEVPEDLSRPRTGNLYASPLTVEHQFRRPTSPPLSPLQPPKPRYARSISSTSTAQKSEPPRRDSISSRLSSTPSRRGSETEFPHSMSDLSINSITNFEGSKDEKKESRKSRLFKRMSNISAASRRSIASALSPVRKDIKEEPIVEHHEPSRETIKPLAVEIGDVNIQFPDTLLWKRRHMRIDEGRHLVLSASKSDNNTKVITKRYPFTEFSPPYLPDQDQQELPNSKYYHAVL
ncbi:MAG: hypothetical protein Q9166_004143 [cf. Caloplaca sp. 2 TL-2023]